jgi:hypothetical protein
MGILKVTGAKLVASLGGLGLLLGLCGCGSSSNTEKATAAVTADAGGGGDAGPPGMCVSGDRKPCSSFVTPTGTMVPLGEYGAIMEPNVGAGFENPLNAAQGDAPGASQSFCQLFAMAFAQSPKLTSDLLNTNQDGIDLNFALYTVYRPATWPAGPIPILTWGNGTCAQPEGYGALLRYVASYGFFVIAANSREVGTGADMLKALDYAAHANADPSSPYYKKLDTTRIGAMGHSQGSSATASAASDSRIKDVILFNGGDTAPKPYLAVSGDTDITNYTPAQMSTAINGEPKAAWLFFHMVPNTGNINGHLTLMLQPERVTGPTVAWWKMVFEDDPASRADFVGASCGLCNMASEFEFGEHGLEGGD